MYKQCADFYLNLMVGRPRFCIWNEFISLINWLLLYVFDFLFWILKAECAPFVLMDFLYDLHNSP